MIAARVLKYKILEWFLDNLTDTIQKNFEINQPLRWNQIRPGMHFKKIVYGGNDVDVPMEAFDVYIVKIFDGKLHVTCRSNTKSNMIHNYQIRNLGKGWLFYP